MRHILVALQGGICGLAAAAFGFHINDWRWWAFMVPICAVFVVVTDLAAGRRA